MSRSTIIHPPRRRRRIAVVAVLSAVSLLVIAFLADTLAASRAEHAVAVAVGRADGLAVEPEVTLAGFPFLPRAAGGRFAAATISARGAALGDCTERGDRGACTATLDARLDHPEFGDIWRVDARTPVRVRGIEAETRIDSVNLGRLMGITDLYINTPAPQDSVGAGGPGDGLLERTDGIMLSGTVPLPGSPDWDGRFPPSASNYRHPAVKVSVSAQVRVVDGRVVIRATKFYDGPEAHYSAAVPAEFCAAVLERFSATLPSLPMAWGVDPKTALSRGSDLIVSGTAGPSTVRPAEYTRFRADSA